ncbi:ribonuclease G [Candidatus Marimicrobium litorale]|uniref:Ribonuclease G n=1 Tax=Candidatus Marimicrobium litorale TaxID=2518991 RepID=A0ABT3T4Y3_9GAMM|nr:ribonuclease G [Candidatus Marimicrobium litorale]MCX2977333.1 ribonuclease G [Candidatus Marimicrobium litorale]
MSEDILVNFAPMETRVALLDNGVTQDVYIERKGIRGLVGNIYAGKVVRVLPGMQAAFVDIGAERTGFIHISDIHQGAGKGRVLRAEPQGDITDHLHEGKKIIVQVMKDPIGSKGARLTMQLSLSARYLVFMPHADRVGVSQLIVDTQERQRLQALLSDCLAQEKPVLGGGFILRTAAEGVGEAEVVSELRFLCRLWVAVSRRAAAASGSELLYEELSLDLRTVRDLARPAVQRILIDSRQCFSALDVFCSDYLPEMKPVLELYQGERPLFDLYGVEETIERALDRREDLKSGGYLIIDQTEAMTTIDVNTGSFVGKRNQAETVLKTNLEAASVLARQLRVRNLGGIIIIDFIDMESAEHQRQVLHALEQALSRDPARNQVTGVSALGLVEMTRKRTRESLAHTLCETCPACHGRGVRKTAETVCHEIVREIIRDARADESGALMVLAAQSVAERLLDEEFAYLAELEELVGMTISVRTEPDYSQENFEIILL